MLQTSVAPIGDGLTISRLRCGPAYRKRLNKPSMRNGRPRAPKQFNVLGIWFKSILLALRLTVSSESRKRRLAA